MPVKGHGIEKNNEATKIFAAAANDVKSMKNLDDEGQKKVDNLVATVSMVTQCTQEIYMSQEHKSERVHVQEQVKKDRISQTSKERSKKYPCCKCQDTFDCPIMRQMHVLTNHAKHKLQCKYCAKKLVKREVL